VGIETARACVEAGFSPPVPAEAGTYTIWEIEGKLITGEQELTIHVDDFTFRLSTSSFFQVNRHLLSTMISLLACFASSTIASPAARPRSVLASTPTP